jgi:hypothetical protein
LEKPNLALIISLKKIARLMLWGLVRGERVFALGVEHYHVIIICEMLIVLSM